MGKAAIVINSKRVWPALPAGSQKQVLAYTQIYEKAWGSTFPGNEKAIWHHLYYLRKKISISSMDTFYVIRCVREVGYGFGLKPNKFT